ncbi:uncharacterized protein LOC109856860 isoform X2 [Pseudomyrmex gracilis]|uniref:uncharacterized protein LOC109856860 isoform X2 n=1 Tax=Pseudomyrmex gracilis TaxID=219809 RepID=UPI000994BBFB|nr:uncharacterized protein LOC109856860 isoform X2 [Pseudomyrmex gracilis]
MFKRIEKTTPDNEFNLPAKRAKLDIPKREREKNDKTQEKEHDDLWGDDFAEEDIEEMDFIASQACLQENNTVSNAKHLETGLHSEKTNFTEKPTVSNRISQFKIPVPTEKSKLKTMNMQGTSQSTQDLAEINYSQFRNRLMDKKDHNSTFQKGNSIIMPDNSELERLKSENKKLQTNFETKNGETVFLRQQLKQIKLRAENEKSEKMRLIEEQANQHRSEINEICKEKEQLKTQIELQKLDIENLLERCKLLESGNIKLKEPQTYANTSLSRNKCNTSIKRPSNKTSLKEACVQANTCKKTDYHLKTSHTYFPLAGISEFMVGTSSPEKPIVNVKITEKTGRRNLPILQEEESSRIFENPDLVKPVVTMVDEKRLTTEFVLQEITALGRKVDTEIESEKCIPIINKLILATRELVLNVVMVLQTIFQAMSNDDIRDMNDLYFSKIYNDHVACIKSECEAGSWHDGERGIEARRLLGAISEISLESTYLRNYLTGRLPLNARNDECYNSYLRQMTRYNAWPKKDHQFEILEIFLECVTLIRRVRRSHQFTGLINAILKVLCNVQRKDSYCEKGLEYVSVIFKEIVFSRPLSLCYVSLARTLMIFSSKSNAFMSNLCKNSQSMAIKTWNGALHFTPDACVLQILLTQMEHFYPNFLTTVNLTHALISSVWYVLQMNGNLLRPECSETCNCYIKLLRFTINMLRKCSETRLDVIDNSEWQDPRRDKCYILKRINYKDYVRQMRYVVGWRDAEKRLTTETYPDNLDQNFWSDIKKMHYKVLRLGISFLSHLAVCDPDFVTRFPDIENSFHLFMCNIAFFDDLSFHENEREALNRIKSTFVIDKSVQSETETHHRNVGVNKSSMTNFKKKAVPTADRSQNHVGPESHKRSCMIIKALYDSKLEYRDK